MTFILFPGCVDPVGLEYDHNCDDEQTCFDEMFDTTKNFIDDAGIVN